MSDKDSPLKGFRSIDGSSKPAGQPARRPAKVSSPPVNPPSRRQAALTFSEQVCGECGETMPPELRFCSSCGTSLASGAPASAATGLRKQSRPASLAKPITASAKPAANTKAAVASTRVQTEKFTGSLGAEIFNSSSIFALQADKAEEAKRLFVSQVTRRGIPHSEARWIERVGKSYFLVRKDARHARVATGPANSGEVASTLVYVEPYGNDLLVEVKHFELSKSQTSNNRAGGFILTFIGILTFWTGFGLMALFNGLSRLGGKEPFNDKSSSREQSKLLLQAVIESLAFALEKAGVEIGPQPFEEFE